MGIKFEIRDEKKRNMKTRLLEKKREDVNRGSKKLV